MSQSQDVGSGSTDFRELVSDFFLQQIDIHPTGNNNVLDLVFAGSPETVGGLECVPPTRLGLFGDRGLLFFGFSVHAESSACDMRAVCSCRLAGWGGLSETLGLTDLVPSVGSTGVGSGWRQWMDFFLGAVTDRVPVGTFGRKSAPPWLDSEIERLLGRRKLRGAGPGGLGGLTSMGGFEL